MPHEQGDIRVSSTSLLCGHERHVVLSRRSCKYRARSTCQQAPDFVRRNRGRDVQGVGRQLSSGEGTLDAMKLAPSSASAVSQTERVDQTVEGQFTPLGAHSASSRPQTLGNLRINRPATSSGKSNRKLTHAYSCGLTSGNFARNRKTNSSVHTRLSDFLRPTTHSARVQTRTQVLGIRAVTYAVESSRYHL